MKKFIILPTLLILFACIVNNPSFAQEEIKKEKSFKNTIRFNITNPLIFGGKALIFGYERTLGKHQSFSVNLGQTSLPKLFNPGSLNDSLAAIAGISDKGLNASIDYRFYLKKENKYDAPRGVYIGPYYSYNFFERKNNWHLDNSTYVGDVTTTIQITMNTVGAELGYQFILWKRMTIDLILIGPGMAGYKIEASLNTTLNPEDEAELFQKINDALADKIPGYSLVINEGEFKTNGISNSTNIGFRYMVHVGFRF
ncbi:MAG: hypothetical protein ACHQNT_01975 [Bacteroidia bacterium]